VEQKGVEQDPPLLPSLFFKGPVVSRVWLVVVVYTGQLGCTLCNEGRPSRVPMLLHRRWSKCPRGRASPQGVGTSLPPLPARWSLTRLDWHCLHHKICAQLFWIFGWPPPPAQSEGTRERALGPLAPHSCWLDRLGSGGDGQARRKMDGSGRITPKKWEGGDHGLWGPTKAPGGGRGDHPPPPPPKMRGGSRGRRGGGSDFHHLEVRRIKESTANGVCVGGGKWALDPPDVPPACCRRTDGRGASARCSRASPSPSRRGPLPRAPAAPSPPPTQPPAPSRRPPLAAPSGLLYPCF